ncbi:hypothetical protein H3C65_04285 [Patescibacteria group bacterium]|nr:hypothetical protein [Patescibacteria group bacterium]
MTINHERRFYRVKSILEVMGDKVTPDSFLKSVNICLGITKQKGRVEQLKDSPQMAPIVLGLLKEVYGSDSEIPDSLIGLYKEAEEITKNNSNNAAEITQHAYGFNIFNIALKSFNRELYNSSGNERLQ